LIFPSTQAVSAMLRGASRLVAQIVAKLDEVPFGYLRIERIVAILDDVAAAGAA
jgi:hypothetical protein